MKYLISQSKACDINELLIKAWDANLINLAEMENLSIVSSEFVPNK